MIIRLLGGLKGGVMWILRGGKEWSFSGFEGVVG